MSRKLRSFYFSLFRAKLDVKHHREGGFTLIELLVVLAILALLIGLAAPAVLRQFGGAKEKIARQSVARLAGVLDLYKLDIGTYPSSDQGLQALVDAPSGVRGWHGPYLKDEVVPEDPWGHAFVYRAPSRRPKHEYDLCSPGPPDDSGATSANAEICNP
jgi:general secretion pathway protein G